MKSIKAMTALLLLMAFFTACKKEKTEPELTKPTLDHIEIGYANNKQAIRGRDFHFNADVAAGDKISTVEIKILQKSGNTYSGAWKMEINWVEFKGAKNTTVHKHFTIPAEAPEGTYDFHIIVNDENGTKFELIESLVIIDAANMPIDPLVDRDIFMRGDSVIYQMNTYIEKQLIFKKDERFTARAQIRQIQGDGIMYTALIKRKLNHFPETVAQIDFDKVIIMSKTTHTGLGPASKISTLKQINGVWGGDDMVIGAEKDALGNIISKEKAWESGQYDLVIIYWNSTYHVGTHKSIPITIQY